MTENLEYEYFFNKVGDDVFLHERFDGGEWQVSLTPYAEIPFILTDIDELPEQLKLAARVKPE